MAAAAAANGSERLTAGFAPLYGAAVWLFGGHRPAAALALLGDLALAGLALWLLPRMRSSASGVVKFFGVALPVGFFYLLYLQSGLVDVALIHWKDAELLRVQQLVLASVPAVSSAALRAWFEVAYFLYPVMLPLGIAALLVPCSPQHDARAATAVRRIVVAFAFCYVVALLYPALSPRFVDPERQLQLLGSGAIGRFGARFQVGMVPGSSFPSAHLAATTTLLWDLYQARRRLFWALVPVCLSMTVGTVLFLYHYVPDVIAGMVVGLGAVALDARASSRVP